MKKIIFTILFFTAAVLIAGFDINAVNAASNTTLDFDGSDDYVVASDNAVFDQADRLSVSVWIQPDDTPSADEYIVYRYYDYYLKIDDSRKIIGSVHSDAERVTSVSAITCDGSAWTHIEMTYDKDAGGVDEIKLYINGVLDGVGDYSTANAVSDELLYIGAADLDGVGADVEPISNFFDGKIDDVRLYQYARSASDVRLDYNEGLATRLGGDRVSASCSLDPASCMDYGLVGYWNMNEGSGTTLYDQSDNSNDGTLTNGPKWTNPPQSPFNKGGGGSALSFDGTNDYVNCGNDSSLNITDAITIEAWVKPVAVPSSGEGLASKTDLSYGLTYYTNGQVYFYTESGAYCSSATISIGEWTHIVGTYDGTTRILYFNGIIVNEGVDVGRDLSSSADFKMGHRNGYFNGAIDEVAIYNRALSAEEVRYHYNRGDPVAHWKFDEGEGSTAFDESSNNNDGTLHLGSSGNTDTSTAWVEGNPNAGQGGSAIDFDGEDDYIDCGNDGSLTSPTQGTIEAWVNVNQLGDTDRILGFGGADQAGVDGIFSLEIRQYTDWYFAFTQGSDGYTVDTVQVTRGSTKLSANQWYHVVWISNGSLWKLYVDGNLETLTEQYGNLGNVGNWFGDTTLAAPTKVTIGAIINGGSMGLYFNGAIDDVRIYNYARTQAQIQMDYNAGLGTHLK